jgi:FMN phosphatase YigB (HAD superfamily)
MTDSPAVIVDVDGTLVDVAGIRHYVLADPRRKNFEQFHAASSYVAPMPLVVETVHALQSAGLAIVVLTSRKERWRHRTRAWLAKWEVPVDALGMRADHDERRDDDVKRDLYGHTRRLGYDPVLAIDDNPIVVALWRSLDIPTVVVPGWITEEELRRS